MGPGRWGTSDPWLGIPVNWEQISNSKAIIEIVRITIDRLVVMISKNASEVNL